MKTISIIVPCYNEEESIPLFYKEVNKITEKMKDIRDWASKASDFIFDVIDNEN